MEALVLDFINGFVEKNVILVYILFFVSNMLQLVFPPHPGDVVLVFQGYLTTLKGNFNFIPILFNAIAGTFIGSLIVYKFGFHKGDTVFKYRLIKKYIDEKHKKKAEKVFEKYGLYAIFLSKFIPGVNAILILFAGIFKVRSGVVYLSVLASSVVHHILVLLLGRFLGNNMQNVKRALSTYNGIVIALLVLTAIGIMVYKLITKRRLNQGKV
ncbi:MAG: DedA family protein [Clostridia bacterium]|nr:DedA family protein [Clostridia bacterium]